MILYVIPIAAFVLLGACWAFGETEFRTKVILTLVYLATWLLAFVEPLLLNVAQGILMGILWWMLFGSSRR
jgi:hypothetical protein